MSPFFKTSSTLLLAAVVAACSSTPKDDDSATSRFRDAQAAEAAAADQTRLTRPDRTQREEQVAPVTAENFHNHPSNYDDTTDTRIIYFAFDSNTLPAASFAALRAHASHLKSNPNARLRLEGHTDERGTREYNIALGERRSRAVEQFLRVQGVNPRQLELISYGEEMPAARGSNEMSWARNRRVELNYSAGRP